MKVIIQLHASAAFSWEDTDKEFRGPHCVPDSLSGGKSSPIIERGIFNLLASFRVTILSELPRLTECSV